MSFLRKLELGALTHLFKNQTIRLAKRRTTILKRMSISIFLVFAFIQLDTTTNAYISGNDEQSKPFSFYIDGPDPFRMTEEEWEIMQGHYMNFHYR